MNDIAPAQTPHFLARIVAAAQDAVPAIEPHLPSLFEPGGRQRPVVAPDDDDANLRIPQPTLVPFAPNLTPLASREARLAAVARPQLASDDSTSPRPRRVTSADVVADRINAPNVAHAGFPASGEAEVARAASLPRRVHRHDAVSDDDSTAAQIARAAIPESIARREVPALSDETAARAQEKFRADSAASVPPAQGDAAALLARRISLEAFAPVPVHPRNTDEGRAAAKAVAADVHISIGRVEIRAATATQKPAPAPIRERGASRLAEYLAQREQRR